MKKGECDFVCLCVCVWWEWGGLGWREGLVEPEEMIETTEKVSVE